jgi:hypothetical protein
MNGLSAKGSNALMGVVAFYTEALGIEAQRATQLEALLKQKHSLDAHVPLVAAARELVKNVDGTADLWQDIDALRAALVEYDNAVRRDPARAPSV